jgi:hypothetical protein
VLAVVYLPSLAQGAGQCSQDSYSKARALMSNRLLAAGYSRPQVGFLMRNAGLRISSLRGADLNDAAKPCGIDSARAHVLSCLNKVLFPLEGSKGRLDTEARVSLWGRKKLSGRELLFIYDFTACLITAKQAMFRG